LLFIFSLISQQTKAAIEKAVLMLPQAITKQQSSLT